MKLFMLSTLILGAFSAVLLFPTTADASTCDCDEPTNIVSPDLINNCSTSNISPIKKTNKQERERKKAEDAAEREREKAEGTAEREREKKQKMSLSVSVKKQKTQKI